MQVIHYNIKEYCAVESELCDIHSTKGKDFDDEYELVCNRFRKEFSEFENDEDYEIPEYHSEIRMLWVYLYKEDLYDSRFISRLKRIIDMPKSWFAQFECYSKNDDGGYNFIGDFIIYKDSLIFDENENWDEYKIKLGTTL